jgi:hypothetical protein
MPAKSGKSRGRAAESTIAAAVDIAAWLEGNDGDAGARTSGAVAGSSGRSLRTTLLTA